MSTTYTPNIKLAQPALGDTGWSVPLNGNCTALDGLAAIGGLAVTPTEIPSASLNVKVAAGNYVQQDGTIATYAGASSTAIAASTTKYLYLDLTSSGALTVGGSFPATAHVRLAVVVAGSSTITTVTDNRLPFTVCGSIVDGVNWTFGTATGTKIGTAVGQKLGLWGATPVVQPLGATQAAPAAYATGAFGLDSDAHMHALYDLVVAIRTALVAAGIIKGSA